MIEHLIKEATCRVVCGSESGTGWLIAKDCVITARHCVLAYFDDGKPVELFFQDKGDLAVFGKVIGQSEDCDACLLSLESTTAAEPLPVNLQRPREGEEWETFGYPSSKAALGHRLSGTMAQVLDAPKLGIDLDLSIDPTTALQNYRGLSGAPLVCRGAAVGLIRLKLDGTIAALSLRQMKSFLAENNVAPQSEFQTPTAPLLADRGDFADVFEKAVQERPGCYVFLEGPHGYGKSTFCANFRHDEHPLINLGTYRLADPDSALGADYRAHPQVFLDWLSTKVSGLIFGKPPRKEERNYPEQIQQSSQYLEAFSNHCAKSERPGMLFIDGLNEVSGEALLVQLLGLLPAKLPSHVTVVLTAPNFGNIAVSLAGKVKTSDVFKLPPLSDAACYRFCQKALKPERRSPALANRIGEKAKGHPLYLRYLIQYSNLQTTDNDLDGFPVLTGPIEEYYKSIWTKLLPDDHAVNLLALMARLRWGILFKDFAKALNPTEQAHFVSVTDRIRHLLTDEESTAIYHASFAAFIIDRTAATDESAYRRLAKFCLEQPDVRYCALNRVFHLLRAGDIAVFAECNQSWFDTAVTLGIEPDSLIADVDAVVKRAALKASPDEFFRLTLLAQRISFRYDTLFAQSARLIAEALIVLGRPDEALQHVLRLKTLIVGPDEALEIAFLLHRHGYNDDALTLLDRVQQRIVESYGAPMHLGDFLRLCSWHIQTVFLVRLSDGWNGMKQVMSLMDMARRACNEELQNEPAKQAQCLCPIFASSPTYFLTFRDEYADLETLKAFQKSKEIPEPELPPHHLQTQCIALLNFESTVDSYHLPKGRKALVKLFADLAEMIPTAEIVATLAGAVADTLIRFGAPASLVELVTAKGGKQPARPLQIKAKNGVDVNHKDLLECRCDWRVAAFLDHTFRGPSGAIIAGTSWFESIEHLMGALYCLDGKARRAKADSDEMARVACRVQLKTQVIEPLRFTLQQRAAWSDSYAIPESALPSVYRQLAELLIDSFPEELPQWLDILVADADGQWGMYSEGFRAAAFGVLEQLTREEPVDDLALRLLGLLRAWRDHVLRGVENRHELVPEILRMIPLFVALEAKEEAERLYQRLLSVSMGPTWYKEDQLGIMIGVLGNIAVSKEVGQRLPQVAGYLERASGEMTFQRFVRAEKSSLLGQTARHGRYRAALAYFRGQCCGTTAELWAEAQQGPIDKVGPLKGNRFPGGALDDQAAVLALVRNSTAVQWPLRWALLEIFHCGDSRHLKDYAETFAKIANVVGADPELVRRADIVAKAETPTDERASFASAFRGELKPELHSAFATALVGLPPLKSPDPLAPPVERQSNEADEDGGLFLPGTFGRQKALREAAKILEKAEKQWALGNRNIAKTQAVKVLQTAQEGGWSIWGNLSAVTQRAEEILVRGEASAANVIRYYSPLIEAERYVQKWIPAEHLIGKVGSLLTSVESQRLLDAVIDHCRLVVGDATQVIQTFNFLADDAPEMSPDVEFFRFTVWLCNHPQRLRRDRAAALLLWLFEQIPDLLAEFVNTAFSMDEGYGPDVLCGVLDGASVREPAAVWKKITDVLNLTKVTQELRHVSRMAVLERLATRAEKAGSSLAKTAIVLTKTSFTGKRGAGGNAKFPIWAGCLAREWRMLVKLLDPELVRAWEKKLEQLCSPLGLTDALTLETAVAASFREGHNCPLNRWGSKLRQALNLALWPHVTQDGARVLEATLRPYNPSQPERTVQGTTNPFTDQLMTAIKLGDYKSVLGSNATVLLNYHDIAFKSTEKGADRVEVLCMLLPSSNQWGAFSPKLEQSFKSSELPVPLIVSTPFETCCRLDPEVLFFGAFTPAIVLPFFQSLVDAETEVFVRQNWRYGRRNKSLGFGQPEREGCSLSVSRAAMKIPSGFKLAWIVWLNGEVVACIDEYNNKLV